MKFSILLLGFLLLPGGGDPPRYQLDELTGHFQPASHPQFRVLKNKHTTKPRAYLREEVYRAFRKMWRAARRDGHGLKIVSATRNFRRQAAIWNGKWNASPLPPGPSRARHILRYSSMPGTSRHHWGTDLDINALNNAYFESGKGKEIYEWMQENAADFGFYQPYTAYNGYRDTGYREEKWHWSYYPLARDLQRAYLHLIRDEDLQGFQGAGHASSLKVINNYVRSVAAPPES